MDINLLVQRLQHGESYTAYNAEAEPYTVNRPPTQITLKAAQAIVNLNAQLQQAMQVIQNLQIQVNELAQQIEISKATESST